jgi:hypothetical protein
MKNVKLPENRGMMIFNERMHKKEFQVNRKLTVENFDGGRGSKS